MNTLNEILRALGRIEGELIEIHKISERVRGLEIRIAVALVLLTAACTAHYKLHPGALNTTDSAAYDTLLIAEAAIDQARAENQTRPFSPEAKDALNTLIRSYNVAREAWLTYRGAVAANVPSDQYFQQLNVQLSDLVNAIEGLKAAEAQAQQRAAPGEEVKP